MEPRRALIAIVKDGVTPLCYKWSDNQQSDVPTVQYSKGRKITVRRADVAVLLRINISTIRRAVLRRGCTLTYQHSDGLYSNVAVPLHAVSLSYKDIYLPATLKCAQEFVLATFHSYSALPNRQHITISHG